MNYLLNISIKNKPLIWMVYMWLLLCLTGMGITYTLSENLNWTLSILLIFIIILIFRNFGFSYKIVLKDKIFEIRKMFLCVVYSNIKFVYDSFSLNEDAIYFYSKNQTQRLSIIYTEDLELDNLKVTDEKGKSIQIDSNEDARLIFKQLVSQLK